MRKELALKEDLAAKQLAIERAAAELELPVSESPS